MKNNKYFFAVDLGATSGRTIVGSIIDGKIEQDELTRFDNNLIETGGHFYWDIYALYDEIIKGLKLTVTKGINITSIGIDTWGVDFVCIGTDGAILRNPLAYRDPHTAGIQDKFFQMVKKETVYNTTGIQFMDFNSLFQLYAMKQSRNTALQNAEKILFIPDALSYMLTGKTICEYTIASTSQLLDPKTKKLDEKLLASVGLSRHRFGHMIQPATIIAPLSDEVQKMTGLKGIPVIAVAGHDTASAVAAVPAKDKNFAYLSSGTWSLMGIETPNAIINKLSYNRNFTNEGGIDGTTRFLKNICGMWLLERCRKEWTDAPKKYADLLHDTMKVPEFRSFINPDDPIFANPPVMQDAIQEYCLKTGQHVPQDYAEICRCIFESLALRYKQVFGYLKEMAPFNINTLHIIGGGSLNEFLDQFTANAVGVEVLAGPQESTALGNIMLQAKAAGDVNDIWEMRQIIAKSIEMKRFVPQDTEKWNEAYKHYLEIVNK
jgi:rhamnulokinase